MDFIKRVMTSNAMRKILKRDDFEAVHTVKILISRDDFDWVIRVDEMRQYCESNKTGHWRSRAPMRDDAVFFDFEIDQDAVYFKLKFG